MNKIKSFGYYGAKQYHLDFILPLLPKAKIYVEPFHGACSVFLNRRPISHVNVLNDKDNYLHNLFKVLRNDNQALIDKLKLTPYSRQEFIECRKLDATCKIELARQTLVTIFFGFFHTTRATDNNQWRKSIVKNLARTFETYRDMLKMIEPIIKHAHLDNRDAIKVISDYQNEPDALFYVDPPYLPETRDKGSTEIYGLEMTNEQHTELLYKLNEVKGKVAISGYHNELYDRLLKDWQQHEKKTKTRMGTKDAKRTERIEVLYTNYKTTNYNLELIK